MSHTVTDNLLLQLCLVLFAAETFNYKISIKVGSKFHRMAYLTKTFIAFIIDRLCGNLNFFMGEIRTN